jgi:hypothetical protein
MYATTDNIDIDKCNIKVEKREEIDRWLLSRYNSLVKEVTNNYEEFDLNKVTSDKKEMKRILLMNNQLRWLTSNKKDIYTKSKLLYNLYKNDKLPKNVKDRCCNFPLLEEKSKDYLKSEKLLEGQSKFRCELENLLQ